MKALICLILLVFCLGCTENETTITAPVPTILCEHADSIIVLNQKVKHWQYQHNAWRKIAMCYGQWFQDHPDLEMPDCHANY